MLAIGDINRYNLEIGVNSTRVIQSQLKNRVVLFARSAECHDSSDILDLEDKI